MGVIIDMTNAWVAWSVYAALAAFAGLIIWFLFNPKESIRAKSAVICFIVGIGLHWEASARAWRKVTLPDGHEALMDFPIHKGPFWAFASVLGPLLVILAVVLWVLEWRAWRRRKASNKALHATAAPPGS